MQIKITPRTLGGTEFTAQPARLHLGAQNAEGVDRLVFQLPAEWAGCSVTLHIRHSDGTLAAPLVLDAAHSAPVGRSFTGWPTGQWMLAATDGSGYTAYTRPGRYDVYDILPTDGTEEEPSPSVYEQFIAQVSGQADAAVQAAQSSAASEAGAARQAQAAANAAERAALNGSRAATSASRAESAALRAESFAPEDGTLLSVNGKSGAVVLDAQDVGAQPPSRPCWRQPDVHGAGCLPLAGPHRLGYRKSQRQGPRRDAARTGQQERHALHRPHV